MKTTVLAILAAVCVLAAPSLIAQHEILTIAPESSDVSFTLGGLEHGTHGNFHVKSGTVEFDRSNQKMSGMIIVSAGSGKTGNDKRDKKMWEDVLEAPHFADVSFAPQSYQGTIAASGDSTIQVTGVFTLHGTAHDLTTPMQIHIDGAACTARTEFTVPYVKWGLKDPSIFILKVAKEVVVQLNLTGKLSK